MKLLSTYTLIVLLMSFNISPQVEFTTHTITFNAPNSEEMYAEDIDGDGDLDVLIALFVGNEIRWYENDGNGNLTCPIK